MPFVPDKVGFIPDEPEGYEPSPLETGLASMAPKGLVSAISGLKEAIPVGLEKGFDAGLDTYRRERDMARKDLESSEATNPRSAMIGGIAPYLPIVTTSIPAMAGISAAAGAIDSKADLTRLNQPEQVKKLAQDTSVAGALGLGFGALGRYAPKSTAAAATGAMAGELVSPGGGALPGAAAGLALRGATSPSVRSYILKKYSNAFLDVPEAVTERYLKDPKKVMSSSSPEMVAQNIADTFGEVKSGISTLHKDSISKLSTDRSSGLMTVNDATNILSQFSDDGSKKMSDELMSGFMKRSGGLSPQSSAENLTEIEIHKLKKHLQDLGHWGSAVVPSDKAQANQAAGQVNRILKGGNEAYSQSVGKEAQAINTKNELAKKFGIVPDYSGQSTSGFTYTDRTMSAMRDVIKMNKVDRKRILEELRVQGYGDIADQIQDTLAKQVLTGQGAAQGSRKAVVGANVGTAAGAGIGSMFGGPIGGAIGAVTGRAIGAAGGAVADKYGPRMARKIFDANTVVNKLMQKGASSRVLAPLRAAAERGQDSFATTYFLMSHTDPEFQKLMGE